MGTIEVGDYVYEAQGSPVRVVAVSSVFDNRTCYCVTFEDKNFVVADGEHRWPLANGPLDLLRTTEEIFRFGESVNLSKATSQTLTLPDNPSIAYIDLVDSVPVRCITVWSPDHVFLVGRGLHLTCNSYYR
jgi:replicative DNA helicase